MLSRVFRIESLAVCAIALALAEAPSDKSAANQNLNGRRGRSLGWLSAGEYARINGALVRAKGVPRWPVFDGDVVEAVGAPARVSFKDGSLVRLDEGSAASLSGGTNLVSVTLKRGSTGFVLAGRTAVSAPGLSKPILSGSGILTSDGKTGPLAKRPTWGASGWCSQEWFLKDSAGQSYLNPSCEPCLDEPVPGESVAVCSRP